MNRKFDPIGEPVAKDLSHNVQQRRRLPPDSSMVQTWEATTEVRYRARWFVPVFWIALGTAAVFFLWVTLRIGGYTPTRYVDDLGEVLPPAFAAVACYLASRSTQSGHWATGWGLMSASAVFWCAGQIAWSYYDLISNVVVPFPSLADVGYLTAVPLAIGCLLTFRAPGFVARRALARSMSVLAGICFIVLLVIMLKSGNSDPTSPLGRAVGAAYPLSDLILASLVVSTVRSSKDQASTLLMLGGILAFTVPTPPSPSRRRPTPMA